MNLSIMDWIIVATLICVFIGVATYSRRYSRSVADFLAGNRCAGRYLLCIASGILGVEGLVLQMQLGYDVGLAGGWWQFLTNPISHHSGTIQPSCDSEAKNGLRVQFEKPPGAFSCRPEAQNLQR